MSDDWRRESRFHFTFRIGSTLFVTVADIAHDCREAAAARLFVELFRRTLITSY
jgi:hypothetical protein